MKGVVRRARKLIVGVAGGTVVLLGVAMIVLPGPALVVIPLGLAILATEFVWARTLLGKIAGRFRKKEPVEQSYETGRIRR